MLRSLPVTVFTISALSLITVHSATYKPVPDPEEQLVKRVIKECVESRSRISCFADKAARALENAMSWDVPISDNIQLARNDGDVVVYNDARQSSAFTRFGHALANFLDTHTLSLDLTGEDMVEGRGRGGGGGGDVWDHGTYDFNSKHKRKQLRREKKYMQYAFMVLLGIFGLTGPLVMKTLAIMAAKALIASKMALIIVGSVALKKIFEKDHEQSPVKVHTITAEDDHDRKYEQYKQAYWAYEPYVKPT